MTHTHTVLLYHIVFSTKGREPQLSAEARGRLFPYMAGIIDQKGAETLIINGMEDHVHVLCRLKATLDIAQLVHAIKGGAAAWYNRESGFSPIRWQEGYGAFTVSPSQRDRVYRYIKNQEEHHRVRSFAEEYEELLTRCGVEFDRRFHLD